MPDSVLDKLPALFATVLLGWAAARFGWLTDGRPGAAGSSAGADPARVLSAAAQYLFIPALLFRAMARLDFEHMPWRVLMAFYGPLLVMVLGVYAVQRWRLHRGGGGMAVSTGTAAVPATRAVTAGFGNSVQVGVPVIAALYGDAGLAMHVAIVSLHALILLTLLTVLAEMELARVRMRRASGGGSIGATVRATVRATLIHPVVLPVLAGLTWNLAGWPLPRALDEWLQLLGSAVAPLCLLLIGLSLGRQSLHGTLRGVASVGMLKMLLLPTLVLLTGHFVFRLEPLALSVVVMAGALPPGSNALIFAQRYRTLETETAAATLLCTLAFAVTAPLWALVVARI